MPSLRARLRRRDRAEPGDDKVVIEGVELTGVFAAPRWLRDAGLTSWLLVGVTLLVAGIVWLLSIVHTIAVPLIVAGVIAAVGGQLVGLLQRHRIPRGIGALLVLLLIAAAGVLAAYLILKGVATESANISSALNSAASEIEGWLKHAGVSDGKAKAANDSVSAGAGDSFKALLDGAAAGIEKLSSLAFFVAMTTLSLFFLLLDGPRIRAWLEAHSGVPAPVAHTVGDRTLQSLRGYFLGVTIVALFNAVLVGGGALLLGVPLPGTIAVVTFIGAYVPYIGAWSAGAFSVLLALGGGSPEAAAGMVVIQLLANGPLQQVVQPIAYGAALGLHPLAVLVVTIAGGAMFGIVGLILAAPLTAAIVRISADLSDEAEPAAAAEPAAG